MKMHENMRAKKPTESQTVIQLQHRFQFVRSTGKIHIQRRDSEQSLLCGRSSDYMYAQSQKATLGSLCQACASALFSPFSSAIEHIYTQEESCPRCERPLLDGGLIELRGGQPMMPGTCLRCHVAFDHHCMVSSLCIYCDSEVHAMAYKKEHPYPALVISRTLTALLHVEWREMKEQCGERTRSRWRLYETIGTEIWLEAGMDTRPFWPMRRWDSEMDYYWNIAWIIDQDTWNTIRAANEQYQNEQKSYRNEPESPHLSLVGDERLPPFL